MLKRINDGKIKELGVVGAGAAGIEIALALEYRIRCGISKAPCSINLISSTGKIADKHNFLVRQKLENFLLRRNIKIRHDFRAVGYDGSTLLSSSGLGIQLDEVLWATESKSHGKSLATDLETDAQGFYSNSRHTSKRNSRKCFCRWRLREFH